MSVIGVEVEEKHTRKTKTEGVVNVKVLVVQVTLSAAASSIVTVAQGPRIIMFAYMCLLT